MTFDLNEIPGAQQVRKQLKQLLSNHLFRVAEKQSRLLSYIVENALSGKSISEKDIAYDLFPPYDPENTSIRANINYLRARLEKYYRTAGLNDSVVIALPPGPAYKPTFSYHEQSKAVQHHLRGLSYASQLEPGLVSLALYQFIQAQEADPAYIPAYISWSEINLLLILIEHVVQVTHSTLPRHHYPHSCAAHALELDPGLCLPHILIASSELLSRHWEEARASFNQALSIDPIMVRTNLWYAFYLLICGQTAEALAIAKSKTREQPYNIHMWLIYGLFLYLARQFEDAMSAIHEMPATGVALIFQELLFGLIHLEFGNYDLAYRSFLSVSIVEHPKWEPGIRALDDKLPQRFTGFMAWALAQEGRDKEAEEIYMAMRQLRYVKWLQMAFAELAVGRMEEALDAIQHADTGDDIFLTCIHLWPFLDPFRGSPRFQQLIDLVAYHAEGDDLP